MASKILNIAKAQGRSKSEEERTLLAMWTAHVDDDVKATCAAFSPSAEMLAIGDDTGAISIVDPKTGRQDIKMGVKHVTGMGDNGRGMVMALRFHPDQDKKPRVRVGLSSGSIECFEPSKGHSVGSNIIEGSQILALDYSSDGKWYAAGGVDKPQAGDRTCAVRVFDDSTSKLTRTLSGDASNPGHSSRITCIRFKGKHSLATGSLDGTVKLWSIGDKDPVMSFPEAENNSDIPSFGVIGPSIDFSDDGNYMLIGSARTDKNLLLYDLRMNRLVSEVGWRRVKSTGTSRQERAARSWSRASVEYVKKANILAASFCDGDKIVAGGTSKQGPNLVKVFTPNRSAEVRDAAYPVNEAEADAGHLRDLYSAVASIEIPASVMGIDVSSKPVIRKDEIVGGQTVTEDVTMIAVAATDGMVYGVKMPVDLPTYAESVVV